MTAPDDKRGPLLELLDAHLRRELDPGEAAMTRAVRAFVAAETACFERTTLRGHVTGSAWITDESGQFVVLLHHGKLDRWLQPGGHADGEADVANVARREADEETGLKTLRLASADLFDVDRHWIPARGSEPGHWHYDIRFHFVADRGEQPVTSSESRQVRWVAVRDIPSLTRQESIARMARKTTSVAG